MRVFLTGATGFIGARILPELLARGHEVLGMTRSEAGAESLRAAGATPWMASLEAPETLARGAAQCDAVIHTAFDHNFANFLANCEKDARVIAAMGTELKGSDRPLMVTSGTGMGDAGPGQLAQEANFDTDHPNPRIATELALRPLLEQGVNARVMRLPQVHDTRRQGLISPYIEISRQIGAVAILGEGRNRWPAAHVGDVAALYAMAFDKGPAGTRFHAVAEEGVPMRSVAEVLAEGLDLPLVSLDAEALAARLGWLAGFAGLDMPASSAWTRAELGWVPRGPSLLEDLKAQAYA
ncbi:SDR family oxidoreductase [Pseudooceanicola sp. CBS1P-1]|uniref:NAD(P)H-binding protein n=1 Tax=Pseudooceanicola albus TaxID=2692189 RepID=A0A6L7G9R0_9RHOB|nr:MULTISPECIES: SDR family oxidoreductase [Pseudooceanicola]MBT9386218.1 SDR family oxidoreductase [Pseudooceanicola endophyticus]MXN20268.1 NAD(P)H-binding protein [Pseudooceanicola albus]